MSTNTNSPGAAPQEAHLSRVLGPLHLWALAVGLVISGNYFGWSYGMESGGPMGLLYALIPVTLFYVTFMLSYSELATMIPHAGGPSAYARRAMGPFGGYMNGVCLLPDRVRFCTTGHCAGRWGLHREPVGWRTRTDPDRHLLVPPVHLHQLPRHEDFGPL